ncbi:MAG: 50S ribosomal protein L18 [Candidatus Saccharimonadales bacterium]
MSKTIRKIRMTGTAERPRLSTYVSNRHVIAQVINDIDGTTLAYSSSAAAAVKGSLSEKAAWVGADIAKKAKKAKVSQVLFDRGGRLYHGRVKILAEAARKEGLEF